MSNDKCKRHCSYSRTFLIDFLFQVGLQIAESTESYGNEIRIPSTQITSLLLHTVCVQWINTRFGLIVSKLLPHKTRFLKDEIRLTVAKTY